MKIKIVIITVLTTLASPITASNASTKMDEFFDRMVALEASLRNTPPGEMEEAYEAGVEKIADDLHSEYSQGLLSDIQANAALDPADTAASLFGTGQLSFNSLAPNKFTAAQLQSIGEAAGLSDSDAVSYSSEEYFDGENEDEITEFETAVNNLDQALSIGNYESTISSLETIGQYDTENPVIKRLQFKLTDPDTIYYKDIVGGKFTIAQVKAICTTANIDTSDANDMIFTSANYQLLTDFASSNMTGMQSALTEMKAIYPEKIPSYFANGGPLDKASLSADFPNKTDLTNILQSAGLQEADIAMYLTGSYTGSSSIPSGPSGPTGPVGPKTPSDSSIYEQLQSEIRAGTISMAQVQSELANTRTQIATLQQQLANAESNKLSEDEISEIQQSLAQEQSYESTYNEIIDNPVDPVV